MSLMTKLYVLLYYAGQQYCLHMYPPAGAALHASSAPNTSQYPQLIHPVSICVPPCAPWTRTSHILVMGYGNYIIIVIKHSSLRPPPPKPLLFSCYYGHVLRKSSWYVFWMRITLQFGNSVGSVSCVSV